MNESDQRKAITSDKRLMAIADRIKNLARGKRGERDISPAGEAMCNLTAHYLYSLYEFAEKLESSDSAELIYLISKGENLPNSIIEVVNPEPSED